jgi:hypothetical protein
VAEYSVDYLKRLKAAIEDFEVAFEEWMGTQVEGDLMGSRGVFPTVWAKDDADSVEVRKSELRVAEAAGAAATAVGVTGAYIVVAGLGALDPVANWFTMSAPKAVFTAHDIRSTAANVKGRLNSMLAEAEAKKESDAPGFAPSQLHRLIWTAAAAHWTTHQYRVAVREAAEALTSHWRTKLGREDVDGTPFWQQTLSHGEPTPGRPKLKWPGDADDKTVKSMRGGLEPLAKGLADMASGLNLTVRNPTTHSRFELSEQEGSSGSPRTAIWLGCSMSARSTRHRSLRMTSAQ